MKKYSICLIAVLIILLTNNLIAGTTGKLVGRVTNKDSEEPIAGATILIMDKEMGTITDEQGKYMILNIPAGTYDVKAFRMDYAHIIVEDVKINLDLTTTLNFKLQKKAIGIQGITVKAKKKLVEKDITGTESIVTSEDMEHMPVENIQEIVAVTAGAVGSGENLHIRGGRSGEVVYTVDGMSVSNPVDGGFGMNLDMDAVSDMSVQTGGFTAEFGNAQSAIINLVTKSGGPEYSGKMEFSSDHLFDDGNNFDEIKFALGGPFLPIGSRGQRDKYTFYLNVSGAWTDTRYKDFYSIDEDDILWDYLHAEQIENINNLGGNRNKLMDFFDLGDRFRNNYQTNTKFKFQLSPKHKLTFAIRGDRETYLPYSHTMKYSLQYYNHWTTTHDQQAFTWDHTVSPNIFYTIRGSRFATDITLHSGVDRDWYFSDENWNFNPEDPVSNNYGVNIPGSSGVKYEDQYGEERYIPIFSSPDAHSGSFIDDKTITYTLRGDLTYQLNEIHYAKTGIELKYNRIYKDRLTSPWDIDDTKRLPNYLTYCPMDDELDPNDPDTVGFGGHTYRISDFKDAVRFAAGSIDGYKAYPWQGAYYLQDKMEWEGMIVNFGMRCDFWYLGNKYQVISDSTGGFVDANWDYIEYIKQIGEDYQIVKEKVNKFQLMFSPRLGVSHPITDKDVMHFAYNYQSQLPPMQYVFTSARPEVGSVGANVGNPNLKPETTITYEVGVEHQMAEDYLLDITLFYKNIHNLVSTWSNNYAMLPDSIAESGKQHYLYITNDYGTARGFEFTLRKRFSNFWGFNLGYTYSWATGRNSDVHSAADNLREFPLDWDVRHIASVNFDFRIPEDEEFYIMGFKMPDKLYAYLLWQIQSGQPYTPITPDPQSNTALDTNSERMPWTNVANLRLSKAFNLFGDTKLKFFLSISNLFNTKNINWIDAKTGETTDQGTFDYWKEYDTNENGTIDKGVEDVAGAAVYLAGLSNPGIYSEGRKYNFGISFEW